MKIGLPHKQHAWSPGEPSTDTKKLDMTLAAAYTPAICCSLKLIPEQVIGNNQNMLMMASAEIKAATMATNSRWPLCSRNLQRICLGLAGS